MISDSNELQQQELEYTLLKSDWGFKGVQEEIPLEEANALQIGSVAFLPGQCNSPHPYHRLFDQDGHQDCCLPSL